MKIEIYGAQWCGYCKQAKRLCEIKEIEHEYHDVGKNPELKDVLAERMGETPKTIPQIFIDGEFLPGGYNALNEKLKVA